MMMLAPARLTVAGLRRSWTSLGTLPFGPRWVMGPVATSVSFAVVSWVLVVVFTMPARAQGEEDRRGRVGGRPGAAPPARRGRCGAASGPGVRGPVGG